jgi:hypothetical protein
VRVERRVRQATEPLGGVLMRRGSGGRTLWPDGREDWQMTYFGFV